jgi:hypothetical protein
MGVEWGGQYERDNKERGEEKEKKKGGRESIQTQNC